MERLLTMLQDEFDDIPVKQMRWRKFCGNAMVHCLRLAGWPKKVLPPGPGFDLKSLGTRPLRALVARFIEGVRKGIPADNVPRLERWTDGAGHLFSFCGCY
jgi:hypothetical protein